jgi:hypothetical protein
VKYPTVDSINFQKDNKHFSFMFLNQFKQKKWCNCQIGNTKQRSEFTQVNKSKFVQIVMKIQNAIKIDNIKIAVNRMLNYEYIFPRFCVSWSFGIAYSAFLTLRRTAGNCSKYFYRKNKKYNFKMEKK